MWKHPLDTGGRMQTAEDGHDDVADPEPPDVGNPGSESGDLPWTSFREAAQAAVEPLHTHLGLDLWVVTRVQHDTQRTLAAAPAGTLPAGASLPWAQTLCSRMVPCAPRAAPPLRAVPAYAAARTGAAASVGAYL